MASFSQDSHYQVVHLLNKALQVDGTVGKWKKDEVDGCLENLSASVVLLNNKTVGRKKRNREKTTFHDGLPATIIGTGSDSLVLKRSMVAEIERYTSFLHRNWPTNTPVSSSKLAKAGFFYVGNSDTVMCFSCHGRMNHWDHGDTAMGEHKRLYPKCKFVRGIDNRNVPYRELVDDTPGTTESKSSSKSGAPSVSQNASTGSEDDLVRILKPLSLQESKPTTETLACFKREINRLLSFRTWPITSPVDRYDLASAGFYCVNDTTVQCFACFGRISEWRLGDRPRDEHRKLFPACPFISGHRTKNAPLSASEKDQAIKYFAQTTARESQPHQILSFASDFQRIGGGCSVHGRTTHPLQLVTNQVPTDLTVRYAKYPDKAYEKARLETFYQWPQSHNQIPANLARAGFFASGNDDEVKCFYCGGGLKGWEEGDDPWEEHARWFTRCEWVLQQRGPGFVDIVGRKFSTSYFEPNMGIPPDQSTIQQSSPLSEDTPYFKGAAQGASSAAAAEPAANPREGGRRKKGRRRKGQRKKGDTRKQQSKKQVEKNRQTKKTKSLQEKIFEEGASQKTGSGESDQPGSIEEAAGSRENSTGMRASSGEEDSNEAICEESRQNDMQSEELEMLREKNLCKICLDNDLEILFLPCKHLVSCSDCAKRIDNCPICRELVDDRLYVYMP